MHDDRPLSGDWYDLRAWWRVRRLLVREPELSLEGRPRLGVSAVAFARFLWILLPTALLGLLAAGVALLPDRPESAYEQTARLAEDLRTETLAASAVPGTPEASEGTRRQLAVASAMAFLTLGQPLVDDAARALAAERYRALLASAQRSLSPAQFERRKAGFARELRAAARKLRWLERL